MSGKTEQVQTTGKNLFDDSKNEKGYYTGGLGTVSELVKTNGWSWSSPLNAIENATLSVSVVAKIKSRFQIILADDSNTVLYVNTKHSAGSTEYTHSFNVVEGTTKILISVYEETSPEGVTIMLNEGESSSPYEPYTGGKPSPSPDYPQEIKNVGKYNSDTQKYEVDVNITGKNLANTSVFEQGYLKSIDIGQKVSLNTEVLKSFTSNMNVEAIQGASISISVRTKDKSGKKYVFTDENDTIISGKWDTGMNDYSIFSNIQVPQNACKFYFSVTYDVQENTELQIEVSSKVTAYEPYREPQTVKLSLDQPLRGIGKYKDEVTKDGIIRRIKQIVLNGSEEWILHNNTSKEKTQAFGIEVDTMCEGVNIGGICNRFLPRYTVWIGDDEGFDIYAMHTLYINIEKTKASSVVEFKKWLSENQIIIEAILKKPIAEPLPEDFKQAIESLKTYYPTTVVTTDGGEVNPDIEVTYIADTKNYIDQKIAAIGKTVVETQKALL